jgi:hypothetical protein
MDYIHTNPVKAGFVANAVDWKYSSAVGWLTDKEGLVKIDKEYQWLVGKVEWGNNILKIRITGNMSIEELIEKVPDAIPYLRKKGIRCILCGEPIWGTLEEAAGEKGFGKDDIEQFIKDLNELGS